MTGRPPAGCISRPAMHASMPQPITASHQQGSRKILHRLAVLRAASTITSRQDEALAHRPPIPNPCRIKGVCAANPGAATTISPPAHRRHSAVLAGSAYTTVTQRTHNAAECGTRRRFGAMQPCRHHSQGDH